MSEWIDLIVYAALIFRVWGWLPAWSSHVPVLLIADRNPDWIGAHPEVEQRLVGNGWFRWSCGLWGVVSLAILVAFQIGAWPELFALFRSGPMWEALKDLNSLLFVVGLLYLAGCSVLFFRWLHLNVPLAARRQATLERRSLRSHRAGRWRYF